MNIQIFGSKKSFDTKKAERYFKERNIPYQFVEISKHGMSKGELKSVRLSIGNYEDLTDFEKNQDAVLLRYLSDEESKLEKLFENPKWLKVPIIRNGKQATLGFCPHIWKDWQ